jgi:NADPH-dependent curcumin reductase CurA
MTATHRALHLIARPEGLPRDGDFELRTQPEAPLVEGQVRVAVRYISIDPAMRVWMSEQKSYWPPVGLGEVMRADAIGEVVESRHPELRAGTWVSGLLGVQDNLVSDGRALRPIDVRALPDPTWALGVLGAAGLTAWFGLNEIGKPKAGETVVVSAAAGAVGSAAVQIAKNRGCRVVGIAGGAEKCAYLTGELGADAAIDYKAEPVIKGLTTHCPNGVDVYFDNVGGEILDAVLRRLRMKARIVLCGGISQYNAAGEVRGPANYLAMISARARMEGFVIIDYLPRAGEALAEMVPWIRAGKLKNRVDIARGLEHFPDALRRVYSGANFGKQVLEP